VPFPYDTLGDVADALEELTEQVFSVEPLPWKPVKEGSTMRFSPLVGAIAYGEWYLQGSASPQKGSGAGGPPGLAGANCHLQFPGGRLAGKASESWQGEPFVALDTMSRPYVLTRARGEPPSVWEFTRFRAEANSVLLREEPGWVALFQPPSQADYEEGDDVRAAAEPTATPALATRPQHRRVIERAEDLEEALRLIRNQEYPPAIRFFEEEVRRDPNQLTAWLRLGFAQREHAMRIRTKDPQQARALFSASIHSLGEAATVADPAQKAEALFERSKTLHRRGKFIRDDADANSARADAREAHRLAPSAAYESWLAFLEGSDVGEPLDGG